MSNATQPIFYLDKASHLYWHNGRNIPGISFLLKWHRYVDDTYYTERGRDIGIAFHLATAFLDRGTLDWDSIKNDEVLGRVLGYEKLKKEIGFEPDVENIEKSFHYNGMFGCTIDRFGKAKRIERMILELKGGAKAEWHKIQTGMQKRAVGFGRRFVAYCHPDGTYHLEEHTDPSDEQVGVNLASDYNWRKSHGY